MESAGHILGIWASTDLGGRGFALRPRECRTRTGRALVLQRSPHVAAEGQRAAGASVPPLLSCFSLVCVCSSLPYRHCSVASACSQRLAGPFAASPLPASSPSPSGTTLLPSPQPPLARALCMEQGALVLWCYHFTHRSCAGSGGPAFRAPKSLRWNPCRAGWGEVGVCPKPVRK